VVALPGGFKTGDIKKREAALAKERRQTYSPFKKPEERVSGRSKSHATLLGYYS
jgi:hypothetical protein